tara:strand:+ start:90 stop:476 length:387 start_codon:yes stop_codon:yes gene_type:complete
MGRYYSGNIEGKFWFAVQSSNDGEFFGMTEEEGNSVPYYSNDLKAAEDGIKECEIQLGDNLEKLTQFFDEHDGYNDNMIIKDYKEKYDKDLSQGDIRELLVWYARLKLGEKIVEAIKKDGECYYDAEI